MISEYLERRGGHRGTLGRFASLAVVTSVLTGLTCFAGCTAKEIDHEDSWYVWPIGEIVQEMRNNVENVADGPGMVMPDGIPSTSILERGKTAPSRFACNRPSRRENRRST